MPTYNRIEELERWDVVNYVRGLQGRYPVDTTIAPPGLTGDALPAASATAPTRPAPFFNAVRATVGAGQAAPASPRGASGDTAAMPVARDTTAARGGRRP
jgi:hypothetical protein